MSTVVLLPSAAGVTSEVTLLAARLHASALRVLVVDFPDGGAVARQQHALAALADLPEGYVVVGFDEGSAVAESLACTRAPAAVVLLRGAVPLIDLGLLDWPQEVAAQVHRGPRDDVADVDDLCADVGEAVELVDETMDDALDDEVVRGLVVGFCTRFTR
ncbi:MAG: hypothetical protein ACRYF3_07755 [Janthinobacterium lividum]